jgi:hypothetical protein
MNNKRITRQSVTRDGNRYCGPLVIAALLGCSTAEAAAKVRASTDVLGAVKGMYNGDLIKTLEANGYKLTAVEVSKRYAVSRGVGESVGDAIHYTRLTKVRRPDGSYRESINTNDNPAPFTPLKLVGETLASWLRNRKDKAGTYVINVTDHYVLVVGRKFVDTYTRGEWVPIGKAPHRRTRVARVWQVTS